MPCPAILTGNRFLASSLTHLDCQAQSIGAYGYGALADPASGVTLALTALVTLFIALFGIRLLLGAETGMADVVSATIRIGIVITLATSWPAWRIIGYDLVIRGPAEIAQSIGAASGLGAGNSLVARLQNVDDGLVSMTTFGTGRLTGGVVGKSDRGDSTAGIAMADEAGFGWGRVFFLAGTIGPYALVRLGAGILLACAPLMAGLLLFGQTLGLFIGWLRGLAFAFLANLALSIIEGVELSVLVPWLNDVLAHRESNVLTPSAPTELIVLALAFLVLELGMLALLARIAFMPEARWARIAAAGLSFQERTPASAPGAAQAQAAALGEPASRADVISGAVASAMRREEAGGFMAMVREREALHHRQELPAPGATTNGVASSVQETLGSSFRRTQRRVSGAGTRRDRRA